MDIGPLILACVYYRCYKGFKDSGVNIFTILLLIISIWVTYVFYFKY